MNNGFHLAQDDGGEYTMGMAYLASWKGPVFEKDDPYGDNKTNPDLTAVKHVQEMQIIYGKDYEKIKEAVFKYGGVQTSIYNSLKSSQSKSPYYDRRTSSYCYIGTEKPNHDVVIIGWDDSYSKDNFSVDLEGDGAFICQNSWGSEFGDGGVFFIFFFLQVISLAKGRTKKKNCRYRPGFKKHVNQRCSHFESGCKGKRFIFNYQTFSEVFFSFSFYPFLRLSMRKGKNK